MHDSLFLHVAAYILQQRTDQNQYPMYITAIDLSNSLLGPDYPQVQTIHYLQYKRLFESSLQRFLDFQ